MSNLKSRYRDSYVDSREIPGPPFGTEHCLGREHVRPLTGALAVGTLDARSHSTQLAQSASQPIVREASVLETLYRTESGIGWEGVVIGLFLAACMTLCGLELFQVANFGALFAH
jgi:hypothetical protein